ncbi:MAG: NAD(+) diphosphatase [Salinivirgaceae bacterium]|jgi:NAD+ diphosphatase|nr:NAD(+) diphosphatase [Salinivirgaceae bacterium]
MANSYNFSTINGENLYNGAFQANKKGPEPENESLIFAFSNADILLYDNHIPTYSHIRKTNTELTNIKYIGSINAKACYIAETDLNDNIIAPLSFIGLRQTYTHLKEDCLKAAIYGFHVLTWDRKTKFCGACGTNTEEPDSADWVKICPNCNESFFPKISPAIIVAITHKGKLLMARHKGPISHIYTILAGFVNPGESLEECIHREVFEEAGIKIKNTIYFGSQPWPFPDSLMVGFKAEYVSGELTPDNDEILDLKWFAPKEIPEWPNRSSISRALIDDFINS